MQQHHRQITFAAALCVTLASCVTISFGPTAAGGGGPTRPWPATASCPTPPDSATNAARVTTLINAERAKAGLGAVTLSPAMSAVAHSYACEIAARGTIDHTGTDGSTVAERLRRGGITAQMVAENNAYGQRSAEALVAAWMASPHHRANMLRRDALHIGLGQAGGAAPFWVLDFTS